MIELLQKPLYFLGVGVILVIFGVVLGAAAMLFVASIGSGPIGVGPVILDSGGSITRSGRDIGATGQGTAHREDVSEHLPLTAAEAVTAGWEDPILCSQGRGRYFRKVGGQEVPYFLMYNVTDDLIGIYQFSETQMPLPWRRWEELKASGDLTLLGDHWGLLVFFRDPLEACKKPGGEGDVGGRDGFYNVSAVRGTPTAVVAPTPTPAAGVILQSAAAKMSALTSLSYSLSSEPEGLPIAENILPANIVDAVKELDDATDAANKWIDNQPHRGISGTLRGESLKGLVPNAAAGAAVTLTVWVSDSGDVRSIRIEGPLAPDDPPEAVRVLDLGEFK